jgi:glycosyltransferase involved in cell wall biosynthesis
LISVVIPAHDAAATIGKTLAALADQDLDGAYEVIVVDDGSDDETAALAIEAPGPVKLIRQPRAGAAAARNRGVAAATGPAIAFTDADCFPEPGWLRAGLARLEAADLVQGAIIADPRTPVHPFDRTLQVGGPTGLFESANLFVTRPVFERVGGFEPSEGSRVDRPFGEDAVFGWSARRAGARFAFDSAALVAHAVFARGPAEYVGERLRLSRFPGLIGLVPEMRRGFLFASVFLTRRSASFDVAVAGTALAVARRSWSPLVAAVPYGAWLAQRAAPHRGNAVRVAATELAADAVGFASLVVGSIRHRTLVI